MNVGFVGVGAMGEPMAGHVLKSKKFDAVRVFDINKAATYSGKPISAKD